jgi:hypothetical protein
MLLGVPRSPRVRQATANLLVLPIYVVLSLFYFCRTTEWRSAFVGAGNDPIAFIWYLNWWPYAIRHGLNPFITYFAWFPGGDNILWDTSIPILALLMAPITWAGGPVLSFNILTVTAPALASWTAFLLARRVTQDWVASLIGGYLFGFSSYELGQMLGHLNLEITCLVPLVILICILRVRRQISRSPFVVGLAALLFIQFGVSMEILASICVMGALVWVVCLILGPAPDRRGILNLVIEIAAAAGLALMLLLPFIYLLIKSAADLPPEINSPSFFSTDLLNLVVPTWVTRFGENSFIHVSSELTGNNSERGAYLGLPLLLITAYYVRDNLKTPYGIPLLATAVFVTVLSFGPSLHIGGRDTEIPLPWAIALKLPMVKSALPVRFTMYVSLAMTLIVATWLAPARGWSRAARLALACIACLTLMPNGSAFAWSRWPAQDFFTHENVRAALGPMPNVLILPYGQHGPGMAWQLDAEMQFTQADGYIGFAPWREHAWSALAELEAAAPTINFGNDLAAFCSTHQVEYILLAPGTPAILMNAIAALQWHSRIDHGVTIVSAPDGNTLKYFSVAGDYWPASFPLNWMGRTVQITTHGIPATLTISGAASPFQNPIILTLSNETSHTNYTVGRTSHLSIALPPMDTTTLTASSVFIPERIEHNKDTRQLSVLITINAIN